MSDPKAAHDRANDNYLIAKANRDAAWAAYRLTEKDLWLASSEVDRTSRELIKHKQGGAS